MIDDNDQIVEDFEVAFEEDEPDSYLQSQFDFMYSEDTEANDEKEDQEMLRLSIKKREKDFYGDDEAED